MDMNDIVRRYLDHYGIVILRGKGIDPIMPYILMDIAYNSFYLKYVSPLKLKFQLNKYRNTWRDSYTKFNDKLFGVFRKSRTGNVSQEEDEIIESMDKFDEYLRNDIMISFISLTDCMKTFSFEDQKIICSGLITDMLAKVSLNIWDEVYRNCPNLVGARQCLESVRNSAVEFSNAYFRQHGGIYADSNTEKVNACSVILARKIISWMKTH